MILPMVPVEQVLATEYNVTIGTSTDDNGWGVSYPFQRKLFEMAGRLWAFYATAANPSLVYRTSTDGGATWGSAILWRTYDIPRSGASFGMFFDGTYLHYCFSGSTPGVDLYYRSGIPKTDGTITWRKAEQLAYAIPANWNAMYMNIIVDTDGYPWIGFCNKKDDWPATGTNAIITKSSTNDGTWSTALGFPYTVVSDTTVKLVSPIGVALTDGKTFWRYIHDSATIPLYGRLWNNSSWEDEEIATTYNTSSLIHSAVSDGDDIHLAYLEVGSNTIYYRKRTYGVGWGAEYQIAASTDTHAPLTLVNPNSVIAFWAVSNHIYYRKMIGGVWQAAVDWIDESVNTLSTIYMPQSFVNSGTLLSGVLYTTKASSPYNVRFGSLEKMITISAATDITTTSAILNGNVISTIGGAPTVTVYWGDSDGGTTSGSWNYSSVPTSPSQPQGIASFYKDVTGLTPGTLYYFSAKGVNSAGTDWGTTYSFTTATGADIPIVSTGIATGTTSLGTTLQGILTSLGDYSPVYVYFQYGLTTSYGATGSPTIEQTRIATGGVNQPITGLVANTLYHFRMVARYGTSDYIYGSDTTFTTTGYELLPPTNLDATRGDTTIALSWTKGIEAINTMVRRDIASYPNSISSGTQVYFGTGSSIIDTGLDNTQAYYYSAWSEKDGIYSSSYATVSSEPPGPGEGILPIPDDIWLGNVLVLESYQVTGDQLIVFQYELSYTTEPSQDVSDFFVFEIYDGANITASGPVMAWGEKPGSIYLNPSNALVWGQAFTLKLTGIPSQWGTTIPVKVYSASSPNWAYDRTNLDQLDRWVFTVAKIINVDWIVSAVTGDYLSNEACAIFNRAIGGLSNVRTEICYYGLAYPDYEPPEFSDEGQEALTREENLGGYINGILDDAGELVGMNGDSMGTMIMAFICLILMVSIGAITRSPTWAIVSIVPVIGFGNYIGLIGLAFTLIVASIVVLYFYYTIWVRGV